MDVEKIKSAILPAVEDRKCFIVNTTINKDNEIELTIEREEGTADLEDCIFISNAFTELFDRDKEDYALTVTSAGLDQPFKVLKQYIKAIGTKVTILCKGGKKLTGILNNADAQKIELKYTVKEAVEGKKKKEAVEHNDIFKIEEINAVIPYIEFE